MDGMGNELPILPTAEAVLRFLKGADIARVLDDDGIPFHG